VSKFDPAMSWRKKPHGHGHQGSQIVRTASLYPFLANRQRTMSEHTSRPPSSDQGFNGRKEAITYIRASTSQQGHRPRSCAPVGRASREGARAHLYAHSSGPFGRQDLRDVPCNPRLRVARKSGVDVVKAEADKGRGQPASDHPRGLEGWRTHTERNRRGTHWQQEATQTIPIVFLIEFADTALIRDTMSGASSSRTP
jgi:hypothetical protein